MARDYLVVVAPKEGQLRSLRRRYVVQADSPAEARDQVNRAIQAGPDCPVKVKTVRKAIS